MDTQGIVPYKKWASDCSCAILGAGGRVWRRRGGRIVIAGLCFLVLRRFYMRFWGAKARSLDIFEQAEVSQRVKYNERRKRVVRQLKVPRWSLGAIIGREGKALKEIEQKTQCKIIVPRAKSRLDDSRNSEKSQSEDDTCVLELKGSSIGVQCAELCILQVIENTPRLTTVDMQVPQGAIGRLIGRGGERIKELSKGTSCKIIVDPVRRREEISKKITAEMSGLNLDSGPAELGPLYDDPAAPVEGGNVLVRLRGTEASIDEARSRILGIQNEQERFEMRVERTLANRSAPVPTVPTSTQINTDWLDGANDEAGFCEDNKINDVQKNMKNEFDVEKNIKHEFDVRKNRKNDFDPQKMESVWCVFEPEGFLKDLERGGECPYVRLEDNEGRIAVFMSAIEKADRFWVQPVNEFGLMLETVNSYITWLCSSNVLNDCENESLYKGDYVLAPFISGNSSAVKSNEQMYRCRVVYNSNDTKPGAKVQVYMLDYGDSCLIDKTRVFLLLHHSDILNKQIKNHDLFLKIMSYPAQALECRLTSVSPYGGSWSDQATDVVEMLGQCGEWSEVFVEKKAVLGTLNGFGTFEKQKNVEENVENILKEAKTDIETLEKFENKEENEISLQNSQRNGEKNSDTIENSLKNSDLGGFEGDTDGENSDLWVKNEENGEQIINERKTGLEVLEKAENTETFCENSQENYNNNFENGEKNSDPIENSLKNGETSSILNDMCDSEGLSERENGDLGAKNEGNGLSKGHKVVNMGPKGVCVYGVELLGNDNGIRVDVCREIVRIGYGDWVAGCRPADEEEVTGGAGVSVGAELDWGQVDTGKVEAFPGAS